MVDGFRFLWFCRFKIINVGCVEVFVSWLFKFWKLWYRILVVIYIFIGDEIYYLVFILDSLVWYYKVWCLMSVYFIFFRVVIMLVSLDFCKLLVLIL